MTSESPIATRYAPGLGVLLGRAKPRGRVRAVVIHSTGSGVIDRYLRRGRFVKIAHTDAAPFETALRVYLAISRYGPHYVVGQHGECWQLCAEGLAAEHVGSQWMTRYRLPRWSWAWGCRWWTERWPDLKSPLELAGGHLWDGSSVNANSIGIEVVPDVDAPRGPWSVAAWATLRRLVLDVCVRHAILPIPGVVLGHCDAHPLARTKNGHPYDPTPAQLTPGVISSVFAEAA